MFREMRRSDRQLSAEDAEKILAESDHGVLCVSGDDGYPYGVPINYGYADGKIYIHSTPRDSHKLDAIRRQEKVCLTVVDRHELQPTTYSVLFSSVIVFGRAKILRKAEEKQAAMEKMLRRMAPTALDAVKNACLKESDAYAMIEITPEHITGKSDAREEK